MICFFADNHYGQHPGRVLFEHLPEELQKGICFQEDDWTLLESGRWEPECSLLILNMIGGTCGVLHPGEGAEKALKTYCARGGNILLLHGSSAAFWQWPWWRKFCGLRWVRPGDPDGVAPSVHPHAAYRLELTSSRHPLTAKLHPFDVPYDEIYTQLAETGPVEVLMTAQVDGVVWPQLFETRSPAGSRILSFLPGHIPAVTSLPAFVRTVSTLIADLEQPFR